MATGHLLPGYGHPISDLRRVQSAGYPLDKRALLELAQSTRMQNSELEHIRSNARRLWSNPQIQQTTYDDQYAERPADMMIGLRPTSPTRRNNPHPSRSFLTNRLHYIPGYHNANTTVGRDAYRVDSSVPVEQRSARRAARAKYHSGIEEQAVSPYKDTYGLRQHLDGRSAQAAEAWLQIADDKDRNDVMHVVQQFKEEEHARDEKCANGGIPRAQTAYPSMHRWMRLAGAKEADTVARIAHTLNSDPDLGYVSPNPFHPRQIDASPAPNSLPAVRRRDIAATANIRFRPGQTRGEFLMHPDWPSSIPHHRVP